MNLKNWIKNHRAEIIGLVVIIIIFYGLFTIKTIRDYNNGRISYKGRTYIKSTVQTMSEDMKKNLDEDKPTGKYILGNEVYDIPNNVYHSTVIFLKTKNNKFQIYELSGGP